MNIVKKIIKKLFKNTPLWKIRKYQNKQWMKKRIKFFLEEADEILKVFSETLNTNGIPFWLEFGTLLGYYRERGFIKHDFDFDFGCFLTDASKIKEILTKNGFTLIREFNSLKDGGIEECYLYKHTTVDVFYFRKDENKGTMFCNTFRCLTDDIYVNKIGKAQVKRVDFPDSGFELAEFKGCSVHIPKNSSEHLKSHYGEDFMTPSVSYVSHNTTFFDYEEMPGEYFITREVL